MGSGTATLVGTWKLVSCLMEDIETKERTPAWGELPNGYLVLTSGGRWIVIQTAEGRTAPHTDDDRTTAFRSMLAYSGRYRTEANTIVIKVDVAWDESWNGTAQVRTYTVANDQLHEAALQPYANFGGRVLRGILIWRRDRARGSQRRLI